MLLLSGVAGTRSRATAADPARGPSAGYDRTLGVPASAPPPGLLDQGYFGPESMLRRVISETLVGLSAPRVLLMQATIVVALALGAGRLLAPLLVRTEYGGKL